MATRVLAVDPDRPDRRALAEAAAVIRAGGLVAFATETVYGLGADATREDAVRRIFAAKGRPASNPLIVHVADVDMARGLAARWPAAAQRLAEAAWPGPVTLVVPKVERIPAIVTAGLDTVGLRVPAPAVARRLIEEAGVPLAAPSANRSEHVSPTRAEHVVADLGGRIELVLDSGPTAVGIESTVVDLCGDEPRVLRPGPLTRQRLAALLQVAVGEGATAHGPARSPGQHGRHYAPRVPALRVESLQALARLRPEAGDVVLVVGREADLPAIEGPVVRLPDPETAAQRLYAVLRDCDERGARRLLVLMPPDEGAWAAIRDRLCRATTAG
ncbi:MAG: threonylcarbamoyl-AMP synthase [Myxococcales bacterium]|nr:threonylcarbamoyl-AMP synthase [Myxococcales bacterium]